MLILNHNSVASVCMVSELKILIQLNMELQKRKFLFRNSYFTKISFGVVGVILGELQPQADFM